MADRFTCDLSYERDLMEVRIRDTGCGDCYYRGKRLLLPLPCSGTIEHMRPLAFWPAKDTEASYMWPKMVNEWVAFDRVISQEPFYSKFMEHLCDMGINIGDNPYPDNLVVMYADDTDPNTRHRWHKCVDAFKRTADGSIGCSVTELHSKCPVSRILLGFSIRPGNHLVPDLLQVLIDQ